MKNGSRTRRLHLGLRKSPAKGSTAPHTTLQDNMNTIRAHQSGCRPSTATKTNNMQLVQVRSTVGLGSRPADPPLPLSPSHLTHQGDAHVPWIKPGRSTRSMDGRGSPRRRSTHPYPHARARAHESRHKERDVCRPHAGCHSRPGQGPGCRPSPSHQVGLRPAARDHARSRPCSQPFQPWACPVQVRRQRE